LTGRIDALASGVHLALTAVLTDLNVLRQTDAAAVDALRPRLGADVDAALAKVDGTVIGNLDTRATDLRRDRARLSTRESTLLAPAALTLVAVQRDVLAAAASSSRPDDPAVAPVRAALSVASAALRDAAARAPALAAADQDLTAFQAIQDNIDREVRAARAGIDADLAQSEADLQGRLQADVTLSISQTEETVHVHVDNIDAGAVSRVLDFDVGTGMSVLGIAVLHATVAPVPGATGGGSGARLQGVDLVLQARLTGLQAHVHTDVAAVRDEQQALRTRIEARITALQQSLAMTVTPFLAAKTATATALRTQIDTDLAAALSQLLAATAGLVPPASH